MSKSTTSRIAIFEPDQDRLDKALIDRELTPELSAFLHTLLKRKKWARKINIPSGRNDVAAVIVFSTTLKEGGLEILSELHVFFAGRIMIEKWQILGESERTSLLAKEVFRAINLDKVRVEGSCVNVEFSVPLPVGNSQPRIKTFDFAAGGPEVREVPHPLHEFD